MNLWARRQGFTIVELLIVVVVIAILAAIVVVAYNGIQDQARQSSAQTSLSSVNTKVRAYKIEHGGGWPASLATIGITSSDSVAYQYTLNDKFEPNTYCVTATAGKYSYHVASDGDTVKGPCPDHTGQSPVLDCAAGYVTVPGNSLFGTQAFCAMKYEAKDVGGIAASAAAGMPWTSVDQATARTKAADACAGCRLVTLNEWLTIAHNLMNVDSNWSGGVVGSGAVFTGHNDSSPNARQAASTNDADGYVNTGNSTSNRPEQRRTLTLSNGEVIWDIAGNAWEWVDEITSGAGNQPGLASDSTDAVYKRWTDSSIQHGAYAKTFPGYGSLLTAENSWDDRQGFGQMTTNHSASGAQGLIMGGAYTTGYVNAGIFTLRINYAPTGQLSSTTGFRASYTP